MLLYPECKIAAGWNAQASFQSVETLVGSAPRMTPVGRPLVERQALTGKLRREGRRLVVWEWDILRHAVFDDLIDLVGDWTTDSAKATIRTLKTDMTYGNFNVYLHLPTLDGAAYGAYAQPTTAKNTGVRIVMDIVGAEI